MQRLANAIVSISLLAGCASPKPEAAALIASVERFHRASNGERPARADAVAQVECHDPDVCAAKARCVEATTATAGALRLKQEAETVLDEVEAAKRPPDDPALRALPAKLDEASRLLKTGHEAMPSCDEKILVLRERYGL